MVLSTYADIELKIVWHSKRVEHTERHFFQGINIRSDFFPGTLGDKLSNAPDGKWVSENIDASETLNTDNHASHPLARKNLEISLRIVGARYAGKQERDGRCNDVVYATLMAGPSMQAPLAESIDFYTDGSHNKIDDTDDAIHYKDADFEDTFDSAAGEQLGNLYGRFIKSGDRVLDMMCGAQSYLPNNLDNVHVTGMGLNKEELAANNQLSDWVVHNVNKTPILPFEDNTFDTVIITAAVEYLTDPIASFAELQRITKSGGHIIVTFTDHWNTLKSIRLWLELHAFERLGLVLDYFTKTQGISSLHTETIQGLLRPQDDHHANMKRYADPVFAVYGTII